MINRFLIAGALIPAVLLFAAACGGDDDDDVSEEGDDGGGEASTELTVVTVDNAFEPTDLTVPAGEEVTVTIRNDGTALHNLHVVADGQDFVSEDLNGGDESTLTFTVGEPGTYEFMCDYHVPDMIGELTVQ
ncbi:MAG: cupredoxin domain-containing protein [Dehalococcoidia bacterium]